VLKHTNGAQHRLDHYRLQCLLEHNVAICVSDEGIIEMKAWKVPTPMPPSEHEYKYRPGS
jgi:hypothetical protein